MLQGQKIFWNIFIKQNFLNLQQKHEKTKRNKYLHHKYLVNTYYRIYKKPLNQIPLACNLKLNFKLVLIKIKKTNILQLEIFKYFH